MDQVEALKKHLQKFLSEKEGNESLVIEDVSRLDYSLGTEMYSFTKIETINKEISKTKLVLRMFQETHVGFGATYEYTIMKNLRTEGFSVPQVLFVEEDKTILGKPFLIMEFIEGKMLHDYIVKAPQNQQEKYMRKHAEFMVKLHDLNWENIVTERFSSDASDPFFAVDLILEEFTNREENYPLEAFKPTFDWLRKNKENYPYEKVGFTHKDFHWLNILVDPDETLFMVDWSISDASDIREDIGYTACIYIMIGFDEMTPMFLKYYEEISGKPTGDLTFYEVVAALRLILFFYEPIIREDLVDGREQFMKTFKAHKHWMKTLYEYTIERTGIRIPEFEKLID